MHPFRRSRTIAAALACASPLAFAAPHYTAQVIPTPAGSIDLGLSGLSASGVAFGTDQVGVGPWVAHSVVLRNGRLQDFDPLGARISNVAAMSSAGDIAGVVTSPQGVREEGYLRRPGGQSVPIRAAGAQRTLPGGVNAGRTVVGVTTDVQGNQSTGFAWRDGAFTFFPSTLGGASSQVNSINDAGDMAGSQEDADFEIHAMLWHADGSAVELATLPGTTGCNTRVISSTGHISGLCLDASSHLHAAMWESAGGAPVELAPLAGTSDAFANGVNAAGVAVGEGSPNLHALVWRDGGVFDLQSVTSGVPAGVTLYSAWAIADDGRILAFGFDTFFDNYTMILTPDAD